MGKIAKELIFFCSRYCKGTKQNEISKCIKGVLNNGKQTKYGKNRKIGNMQIA